VEDAENADEPADIMWGFGERNERLGRGSEQNVRQVFLVAADQLPQLLAQGQDDRKRGTGRSSCRRAASHTSVACRWHLGQLRLRQEW
jgi:hypothetical protein